MSIFARASGIYHYDFTVRGRRYSGSTGQTSERAAKQVEAAKRREAELEAPPSDAALTPISAVFVAYWTGGGEAAKSAKTNATIFDRILKHFGDDKPYCAIGTREVDGFIRQLTKMAPDMTDATRNRHLEMFRAMHNHAAKVQELPVKTINWGSLRGAPSAERVVNPTDDELHRLFTALDGKRDARDIVEFLIATGLRKEQALQLAWARVYLSQSKMEVHRQKRRGGNQWQPIRLNQWAVDILTRQRAKLAGRNETVASLTVFDRTNFRKTWEAAVEASGIVGPKGVGDFRLHDLRHTFATRALEGGTPLEVVSKLLGHSSVQVTQRYAHITSKLLQAGVDSVERPSLSAPKIIEG